MKVSRISPLTGRTNTMDLPVTQEQLDLLSQPKWKRPCVQDIFPKLSSSEREFLLTGYTQEDWEELFPPEDDA